MWFWWRGSTCNLACIFCRRWLLVEGAVVTMKDFSAFLHVRRCKNLKPAPENMYLKTCPASFPRAQSASFLLSSLNSFPGVLKVSSCRSTWFNPCRGRRQVPIYSWHWLTCTASRQSQTSVCEYSVLQDLEGKVGGDRNIETRAVNSVGQTA